MSATSNPAEELAEQLGNMLLLNLEEQVTHLVATLGVSNRQYDTKAKQIEWSSWDGSQQNYTLF
jgi:hypothetical protein